jgi:hypothetical protein
MISVTVPKKAKAAIPTTLLKLKRVWPWSTWCTHGAVVFLLAMLITELGLLLITRESSRLVGPRFMQLVPEFPVFLASWALLGNMDGGCG